MGIIIGDYTFDMKVNKTLYTFTDKIRITEDKDFTDNITSYYIISFCIKDNPFESFFTKKNLSGNLYYKDTLEYYVCSYKNIHIYCESYCNNNIFKIINELNIYAQKNVKDPYHNTINFSMNSSNIRTLNSFPIKSDLIGKWTKLINNKKTNIFKSNSKNEMIVCGYSKLKINIDNSKLLACII